MSNTIQDYVQNNRMSIIINGFNFKFFSFIFQKNEAIQNALKRKCAPIVIFYFSSAWSSLYYKRVSRSSVVQYSKRVVLTIFNNLRNSLNFYLKSLCSAIFQHSSPTTLPTCSYILPGWQILQRIFTGQIEDFWDSKQNPLISPSNLLTRMCSLNSLNTSCRIQRRLGIYLPWEGRGKCGFFMGFWEFLKGFENYLLFYWEITTIIGEYFNS